MFVNFIKQQVLHPVIDLNRWVCHPLAIMKPALTKKICMLGPYSVGKTSLVKKFVHGIFSDKYLVTIGVKIDKKEILINDQTLKLMLWDIAGEEDEFAIPLSYLKGCDGCLLVMDGTRPETLELAADILERSKIVMGDVPVIWVINKSDLADQWCSLRNELERFNVKSNFVETSAKLGTGVEESFSMLARQMIEKV